MQILAELGSKQKVQGREMNTRRRLDDNAVGRKTWGRNMTDKTRTRLQMRNQSG